MTQAEPQSVEDTLDRDAGKAERSTRSDNLDVDNAENSSSTTVKGISLWK
jgi:hypothetical protein